ncbi:histidine triad nucleotide-binding protein [Clostridium sp. MSJ-11]|uniref:Histidine triad nucleotide-binding protein n=1 Tax=Clostridium mobile TaxID=2841512 RepID=A0ABS6EE87_9CLOT|nr:histidine triad nucleotide-binding protein [Clostridium mobile]MBU5483525.1 histidine triad nucleotide-binding protein [Clostridium mobile]
MDNCIFCKIIKGEIPCKKVYEDELILAFEDINPEAPVHVLIIPKKHIDSLDSLEEEDKDILSHIFIKAKDLARELGIAEDGYRVVNNCGINGGQTVLHMHFHILGGRNLQWPPG